MTLDLLDIVFVLGWPVNMVIAVWRTYLTGFLARSDMDERSRFTDATGTILLGLVPWVLVITTTYEVGVSLLRSREK